MPFGTVTETPSIVSVTWSGLVAGAGGVAGGAEPGTGGAASLAAGGLAEGGGAEETLI